MMDEVFLKEGTRKWWKLNGLQIKVLTRKKGCNYASNVGKEMDVHCHVSIEEEGWRVKDEGWGKEEACMCFCHFFFSMKCDPRCVFVGAKYIYCIL